MGRLIDADRLKEALHEDCMTAMGTIDESALNLLMIEIDEIPTAYDVDKVVAELKAHKNNEKMATAKIFNGSHRYYRAVSVTKAINIVKGGGQG